ncbi:MAG: hypothetical protein ACI8XX_001402, partial [Polaribacter sp.]
MVAKTVEVTALSTEIVRLKELFNHQK